ncbi:uncharacterized protein PpBr36_09364 [Pyricularia pennisetigena]|uniref:uncharacterized protein n=1 Tax=Pyricularia pennisetigena TaxID=1578925 RepID=UPI001154C653|nr:uncharacterized protein PpBr36_09364 [Pyricularia pennisetigena]TLS21951.1 hypothetical protein PpBr36_09364 [Pyricularia pennisetigena]
MQFKTVLVVFMATYVSAAAVPAGSVAVQARAVGKNGADFGTCTPTMDFKTGRPGRAANQGTFLPTDAVVAKGQQDALNPAIIMNRICDQLINVCKANAEARTQCKAAQAKITALGTKDASTATAFNKELGF